MIERLRAIWSSTRKWVIVPKVLYLTYFAAFACFYPFISIFLSSRGRTGDEIGLISCLQKLVGFIATPIWTSIADKYQQQKLIMVVSSILTLIMANGLGLIPFMSKYLSTSVLSFCLFAFAGAPIGALMDERVISILGPDKDLYGQQRLWGAVGWGLFAFLSGLFIDSFGLRSAFFIFTISFSIFISYTAYFVPKKIDSMEDLPSEIEKPKRKFWSDMKVLISNKNTLCFLLSVNIWGQGFAVVESYLFLFLQDYLHAPKTLMGLSISATVLMELPFFFFGKQMLGYFKIRGLVMISHVAYIIRVFAYTFLKDAWWVLPIEILHGISFSCMWTSIVSYAAETAPKGLESTSQGLFNSSVSLGAAIGALGGGLIYNRYGPIVLFRVLGGAVIFSLIWFVFTFSNPIHKTYHLMEQNQTQGEEEQPMVTLETLDIEEDLDLSDESSER